MMGARSERLPSWLRLMLCVLYRVAFGQWEREKEEKEGASERRREMEGEREREVYTSLIGGGMSK